MRMGHEIGCHSRTRSHRTFFFFKSSFSFCFVLPLSQFMHELILFVKQLVEEMEEHIDFYKGYLGQYEMNGEGWQSYDIEDSEWDTVMSEAQNDRESLQGSLSFNHVCSVSVYLLIVFFCVSLPSNRRFAFLRDSPLILLVFLWTFCLS